MRQLKINMLWKKRISQGSHEGYFNEKCLIGFVNVSSTPMKKTIHIHFVWTKLFPNEVHFVAYYEYIVKNPG